MATEMHRAANGESSIYLGGDGWWHGYVTMGRKPNGTVDRRHRRRRTEGALRQAVHKLERERDAGRVQKAGRTPTVEAWFTEWLTTIAPLPRRKRGPLSPRTIDSYWSICRTWLFPHLGGLLIDGVEPDDLDRLYTAMYAAGRSEATVLKIHAVLRRGLGVAVKRRKITRNVCALVDPPGTASVRHTPHSAKDARKIIAEAITRRNGLRWVIGMLLGPRQGETLALTWAGANLDSGNLDTGTLDGTWQIQRLTWRHGCADPHACAVAHCRTEPCGPAWGHGCNDAEPCGKKNPRWCPTRVPVTCRQHRRACPKACASDCTRHAASCPQRTGGGLVRRRRKGGADHVIGLPADVCRLLIDHRASQDAERQAAGDAWTDNDLIFCEPDGRPIDPRRDYAEWQSILAAAGLPPSRVHSQRHTAATLLLELGVDLGVVQDVLGHADIRTTRGYAQASTVATRRAVGTLGSALLGAEPTPDTPAEVEPQQELQQDSNVIDFRSRRRVG